MMQTILDTAMEYERVLVMARRRDYDTALELMVKILQIQREDPEYNAMYAWLLMQKFPGQDAPLQKMLDAVGNAPAVTERHSLTSTKKRNAPAAGVVLQAGNASPGGRLLCFPRVARTRAVRSRPAGR
jgi:hypothetical protein